MDPLYCTLQSSGCIEKTVKGLYEFGGSGRVGEISEKGLVYSSFPLAEFSIKKQSAACKACVHYLRKLSRSTSNKAEERGIEWSPVMTYEPATESQGRTLAKYKHKKNHIVFFQFRQP